MFMCIYVLYILSIYQSFADNNCDFFIGYNITGISTDDNFLSFGDYASYYKNGTYVQYLKNGAFYGSADYIIQPSNNTKECYMTLNWKTGPLKGDTQCATFSPTEDKHGSIGCYEFGSKDCPTECTPEFTLKHGLVGTFILNPVQDEQDKLF